MALEMNLWPRCLAKELNKQISPICLGITFGAPFYNVLPTVGHCTDYTLLPQLIQEKLARPGHDENELTQLVACVLEEAVDVNMHRLWEREPDLEKKREGIRPLADALAKKIGLAEKRARL